MYTLVYTVEDKKTIFNREEIIEWLRIGKKL